MSQNEMAPTKTVGILGGLGPDATVDFMSKVLASTQASCDQDHIRMLVDHNPTVPNRHDAIAGKTPSVGPALAAMANGLEQAGADFLVMVCNTAHAYTADIRAAISIPFISIVDVTVEALGSQDSSASAGHPLAERVGVMAADGCLQAELYQTALTQAGFEPVLWSDSELQQFMQLVYRIKAGEREQDIQTGISTLASSLVFNGADVLIAGCTEIPLFMNAGNAPAPLLSSTDLLVQRTIDIAKGIKQCC